MSLLSVLFSFMLLAPFGMDSKEVTCSQSVENISQDTIRLNFTLNIADGWHVYSTDLKGGPTSAELRLDTIAGASLAGPLHFDGTEISHYDNMFGIDVVFLGHIDSEQLSCILSGAIALTYPSYFEGFGIPIIEAFYAETPVITSNTTSMPEVAGDAALLIDPHNPKTIADAMCKLLDSEDLCKELIQRGRRQREQFSWERTSTLLWDCMMRAIQ